MPSRKRHRRSTNPTPPAASAPAASTDAKSARRPSAPVDDDVLRRFNDGLRRMEQQKRDERDRQRREQQKGVAAADASKRLERAIAAVKTARQTGHGAAEAELEWRAAKSEVIFLETGERPAWAPPVTEDDPSSPVVADAADAADEMTTAAESGDDSTE